MARYFTNVKNTIEERVNTSYIDTLYTKDAQGEFRKIVAGESGGGGSGGVDYEYLEEDQIFFNHETPNEYSLVSKNQTDNSRLSLGPENIRIQDDASATTKNNYISSTGMRIIDTGDDDFGKYEKDKIVIGKPGQSSKEIDLDSLADIVDKVKPTDTGVEISGGLLDVVVKAVSTQHETAMFPRGFRAKMDKNTTEYINSGVLSYIGATFYTEGTGYYTSYRDKEIRMTNGTNALVSVINLLDLYDSQTNYLKPDKIEFDNGSGLSADGLSYKEGSSTITKTIKQVFDAVPGYIKPDKIEILADQGDDSDMISVGRDSTDRFTRINNNSITIDGTGAIKSTLTSGQLQFTNADSGFTRYSWLLQYRADTNTAFISVPVETVINVVNKLKDLQSSATDIDNAVANSGGTTYPYLTNDGIRTTGTQTITHKVNSSDTASRFTLNSNEIHHQNNVIVGAEPYGGNRVRIQPTYMSIINSTGNGTMYNDRITFSRGSGLEDIYFGELKDQMNSTLTKYRVVNKTSSATLYETHAELVAAAQSAAIRIPNTKGRYLLELGSGWGSLAQAGSYKMFYLWAPTDRLVTLEASHLTIGAGFPVISPLLHGGLNQSGYQPACFGVYLPTGTSNNLIGLRLVFTVHELSSEMSSW